MRNAYTIHVVRATLNIWSTNSGGYDIPCRKTLEKDLIMRTLVEHFL